MPEPPLAIILMGVTGSGKTTVGTRLAARLGFTFYDADNYHDPANIEKMRRGEPMTDADRGPWLDRLRELLRLKTTAGEPVLLACSALRQAYRERLYRGYPARVRFVYLRVNRETASERLLERTGHFMPAALVDSQFDLLEEPDNAICVDASQPVDDIVECIAARLQADAKSGAR
jgi:gluconokinase